MRDENDLTRRCRATLSMNGEDGMRSRPGEVSLAESINLKLHQWKG
jgi:hypothetical protein